ncbi:hypothetical protein RQN30_03370 [Arcanobacterium hippocoleae]
MKVINQKKFISVISVCALITAGIAVTFNSGAAIAADRDDLVAQEKAQENEIAKLKSEITGLDVHVQETF